MGKDPAFLFYPGDWTGGTRLFTRHQKGAYIDLLLTQFDNGHLSLEEIKFVLGKDDEYLWDDVLCKKYTQDQNGLYYQHRLEEEQIKRKKFTQSRRDNAKKSKKESEFEDFI